MNSEWHMIGNAHLDPVWLWRWPEAFAEAKATFRSALDRMNEYDEFIFTSSQAAVYAWIEHNEPAMFAEIRERVAEGRWVLCGGWWLQADCNLPAGESFARQALYGQRYFREKFGVTTDIGYNVDSFGHHAMLPQLLVKGGLTRYVFMRPGRQEKTLPSDLFRWRSADGSEVLAYRIPFYTHIVAGELDDALNGLVRHDDGDPRMVFYGVGNHGGGPTKRNIETLLQWNRDGREPMLRFSSPQAFFADVAERDVPVVRDELQMHAIGCYSACSDVKRWNRGSEQLLLTAEKWSWIASRATDQPYPPEMDRAWKLVLFNQFHDILPGSAVEEAYTQDARDAYGEANGIAERALNNALQSISWKINIPFRDGTKPIVVFNPHGWEATANVELEFGHFGEGREFHSFDAARDVLVDSEGTEVAVQQVRSRSTTIWRQRLAFVATLPALGYRTYHVVPRTVLATERQFPAVAASAPPSAPSADRSMAAVIENERFRLELNPETGCIASLRDKRLDVEVFRGEAAVPAVLADDSDTWSHDEVRFDREIGVFAPVRIAVIEQGPVKSVIRVESEYGRSRLLQDFTLYRELERIDVHVTLDWREAFTMVKLRFPVNVTAATTTYEIPYGTISRPNDGNEYPGLSWFDQTGEVVVDGDPLDYGVSILNDGTSSFDTRGHVMSLTVLRSPIFAWDRGHRPEADGWYDFMDQGLHRLTYALLPHAGDWRAADTVRQAAELNRAPSVVVETYHDGPLPQCDSYLNVDSDHVQLTALKQAEDGDDLIVRCAETHGRTGSATVTAPAFGLELSADYGPWEIKTFRIAFREGKIDSVLETDFLE